MNSNYYNQPSNNLNRKMEKEIEEKQKAVIDEAANIELAEGFYPHQTIVIGWKGGKIIYCRTFNDISDRYNMIAAYNYVRTIADSCVMSSRLDSLIQNTEYIAETNLHFHRRVGSPYENTIYPALFPHYSHFQRENSF